VESRNFRGRGGRQPLSIIRSDTASAIASASTANALSLLRPSIFIVTAAAAAAAAAVSDDVLA
jgi:hypothetical protein